MIVVAALIRSLERASVRPWWASVAGAIKERPAATAVRQPWPYAVRCPFQGRTKLAQCWPLHRHRDRLVVRACLSYRHGPAHSAPGWSLPVYPRGDVAASTPVTYPDAMDDVHPHDPPTRKAQALLRTRFGQLMDCTVMHVRVNYSDQRQLVTIHGTAAQLHGPRGCCTCCPRSPRLTIDGDPVGQGA